MDSDQRPSTRPQTAAEIQAQIAGFEQEIASLSGAIRGAEDVRKSLLLTGSNREIALHDSGIDRIRLDLERAAARADALRAELPAAQQREEQERQQAVHADLTRMGARYHEIVQREYPALCEPLIRLLSELEVLDREIAAHNKLVPGQLRVRPNEFRCDARSGRYFGPLHETVALPGVMQTGAPIWPPLKTFVDRREIERPAAHIDEFGKPPIVVNDARRADPGITVTRVPLDVWMKERDARLKAEEQAKAGGAS